MICIQNSTLIMPDHMIPNGTLILYGKKIAYCGKHKETPAGAEVIDGKGLFCGPGLIDIHLHAGPDGFFMNDCAKAAAYHLDHGSTTVLPTLYFTLSRDEMVEKINYLKPFIDSEEYPNVRGIYVEGPYMNTKYGADKKLIKWSDDILEEEYMPVLEAAQDYVKVWGCAPEREGIERFAADANRINPDIVLSVAHCEATPQQIARLFPYNLRLSTHHTNATGTIINYPECRGCCVDEAVNYFNDIYAELICDEHGIHVDPFMLRLVRKIKGNDKIILITDNSYHEGPALPGLEYVTDINFDFGGDISGTKLTLNKACRNMMVHTGASLCDVFTYGSRNPARLLGWKNKGELREGADSDVILVDFDMNVKNVIVAGKKVK